METAPGGPRVPTRRVWVIVAVALVLVMGLLNVPPLSLTQRILNSGEYVLLEDDTAIAEHPDGLQVSRAAGTVGKVRVKLGAVPLEDIVAGNGPDEAIAALEALPAALEALPAALVPKSPYYTIRVRARDAVAGRLQVVIPNDAEPWETLDLYTWDSETERWVWLPTRLDRVGETLTSEIDRLPDSVLVVQTRSAALRVAAAALPVVAEGEVVWPRADTVVAGVAEIDVAGILIGTMGGIAGDTVQLPPAASTTGTALVPVVRNWVPDRAENWGLVSDMLQSASSRTTHVASLLSLVQRGGYPGLIVDYRSVQLQDRDWFSQFIQELGAAFHDQGLWLGVVVDAPRAANAGSWDTGGYDWPALGAAVDQFRFTMPLPPAAYQPGGEAEQLIQWAVTQVPRYKVMPRYTMLSTDGQRLVAFDTVLSAIGEVSLRQSLTETVAPGTDLTFALNQMSVLTDPEAQALGIGVGETTYWLGTPVWLHTRVELARRYRLGGVALCNLFDDGNIGGVRASVADFDAEEVDVMEGLPEITWTVTDPDGHKTQTGVPLTSPTYAWTAPDVPGQYRFAATMGWMDKGAVEVKVAPPVMTDVPAASGDDDTNCLPQPDPLGSAPRTEAIIGLGQGRLVQLTRGESGECLAAVGSGWSRLYDLSPSATHLLVGVYPHELLLVDSATGTSERVARGVAGAFWLDETAFLAWSTNGDLWSAHTDEVTPCVVATGVARAAYCRRLGRLAIERQIRSPEISSGIHLLQTAEDGTLSEPMLLTSEVAVSWSIEGPHLLWSPDCEYLLFPTDPANPSDELSDYLAIYDVEAGEVHRLRLPLPSGPLYLSSSGERLIYNAEGLDRPTVTWIADLDWDAAQVTALHTLTGTVLLEGPQRPWSVLLETTDGLEALALDDLTTRSVRECP